MISTGLPVSPRHIPPPARVQRLRHRIEAGCSARPATADAKQGQKTAGPKAMTCNRLIAILRACRQVAAGLADNAGKGQLVEPNEAHAEKSARRFPERPLIIPGCGLRPSLMMPVRLFSADPAHRLRLSRVLKQTCCRAL